MLLHLLWIKFFLTAVNAAGEFIILHNPDGIVFNGNEEVDQSLLKEIFSAALGITVKQRENWSGIAIRDVLSLPEAVVGIAVEGVDTLNLTTNKIFPLNVDEFEETTWQALSGRLQKRGDNKTLVRIDLGDGLNALEQSAFGELKLTPIDQSSLHTLSLQNEKDKKFLEEVQLLHAIAMKIRSTVIMDSNPDVYWLVVSGLRPVINLHGKESDASSKALSLLNDALNNINKAFVNAYDGKVLTAVFTNYDNLVRRTRSAPFESVNQEMNENNTSKDIKNLSKVYNENYPVIFNIILWFGVAFFFSLLAICIAIAKMDPGRDSIIYRMTSNRMKKEN